jgi:dTDP-4-dehydrorhamnose 3,5-epimerase
MTKVEAARMEVSQTQLPGVLILRPKRFLDARGFFSEAYNKLRLADIGIDLEFVQDNLSLSRQKATLRGLHFQYEPRAQSKLVSVVKGAARVIVVDLRLSSSTYGRHVSILLSADEGNQVFIPTGFAHGFLTQESDTLLSYKVSDYYSAEHDSGIRFDDPLLAIDWRCEAKSMTLSEKDLHLPHFNPAERYFA